MMIYSNWLTNVNTFSCIGIVAFEYSICQQQHQFVIRMIEEFIGEMLQSTRNQLYDQNKHDRFYSSHAFDKWSIKRFDCGQYRIYYMCALCFSFFLLNVFVELKSAQHFI